ncbi:probable multidrug resistance-associated protein lethal(2)03659 [Tribolium madens]|uniref:probable multidrug resistance-associated protein lethal(2)03659 n=1 Tax=Tribolium madens TaxID=41895 RepID=UPI001CF72CEA|nr:probable multidrug resistance-associated protein lethal(2)03659 [Tribolium madens]
MDHIKKQIKETHPILKANVVSLITFFYTVKLFRKGAKRELEEEDLYEVLPKYKSDRLGDEFEREWEKQKSKRDRNSILRLLWACYGKEIFFLGVSQLAVKTLMIFIQPHALSKIISYFNPNQTEMTKNDLYFYAGLLVVSNIFDCIYSHNYHLAVTTLGVRIRTAFCSFIYRKALKLSPSRLGDISVGKIINLITKDVHALERFSYLANDLWIAILKTIIVSFIIYRKLYLATFAGVGFFLIILPIQIYMGTWAAKLRMKMCKKVDERLQATQETLSAIKIIKMYTWEKFFTNKVIETRIKEIRSMHLIFYLKFFLLQIGVLNGNIAFYLLIMTYKWLGNHITAEIVYFIDSLFHILTHTLGIRFPSAISQIAETTASVKRIGNVLKALELQEASDENNLIIKPKITLKNLDVIFKDTHILHSIDLDIDLGVTLITGPVGSGKSFLLKTILREYEPTNGSVVTQGRISYASQDPWLFPSSIKQNILFGEKYDEARYQEVLKVCALIYDFELLVDGDNTIVEDRGNNLSKGQQARVNLARAVYRESEIYLLDDCLSALDSQVSDYIFKECILKFLQNKLVVFVSHNVSHLKEVDNVIVMRHGAILSHAKSTEISEKEILEEICEEDEKELCEDDNEDESNEESKLITETTRERKVYQEVKKKGAVDLEVYKKYLHYGGGIFAFLLVIAIYGISQFVQSYSDKLVSKWVNIEQKLANFTLYNITNTTNETEEETIEKRDYIVKMFTAMIILSTVFNLSRSFGFYSVIKKASLNLHKHMITHMVNATMSFFDTNFIGNILNRFSKDLTIIDEHLPFIYHQVFRTFFVITGIMTLIATVNTFFLIPTFFFFGLLMVIRAYYLRTARSLKRLDATTRSPVVGHLNATLEGLTTIRAFKAEEILRHEYDRHQDLYTSASYISYSSMRAYAFFLDILCVIFIASIISKFIFFDDDILAGDVGLAISQALRMTGTLQWGVRIWSEMENSMTSVERVLEYTEVKQETKQGQVLENWPESGEVKYEKVYLSYNNTDEYVLKNVNFTANPQEKIGIVGRTGAGKSSIISTLFRLYEVDGKITIDGVDTKTLALDFLRKHVSIIPQDPVLFSGTIRENIDPEGIYSDEDIWKAIETAHLKKLVPSLDYEIAENSSNFSVGQRQLVCLARALVRNNKIIVLDEATANMDPETDALIHQTIHENFSSCTVFTIAHKIHSILNSDKIIVMDKGEIIEYDDPLSLMQNTEGVFYKLVKKSGLLPSNLS